MSPDNQRLIFVGGLHRSGTTPFSKTLGAHPDISALSGTGVPEDEGQHLQSVYPAARVYGGSGHFARAARAHLTENSPLATPVNAETLLQAWRPHWDLSRGYLLEKSPPNIVMSRFLQALFPDASFIMVVRHPVTVALSTKKWTHLISRNPEKFASLSSLVEHWLIAHRLLVADLQYLRRVHVTYYEDLVGQPEHELERVRLFLDLHESIPSTTVSGAHGLSYEQWWTKMRSLARPGGWQRRSIERKYADEINQFGYDLNDLGRHSSKISQLP
ncbi:MAG: sulfotransferase [Nocardioidaceae bacterium]